MCIYKCIKYNHLDLSIYFAIRIILKTNRWKLAKT